MSQRNHRSEEPDWRLSQTEFLAAIVESSHDAIIGKTLEGIITSWNQSAEHIYGYTVKEAIGQPISLIVPPDRLQELDEILRLVRRGERVGHFETERITKTGQVIRVLLAVSPIKDRDGHIIGSSALARDITPIRTIEAALTESERRYQSLFEMAIHGICRATLEGYFLEVNAALVALLGYQDRSEVLGLRIPTDVYARASDYGEVIARCMQGRAVQQDVEWKRKDGKQITIRLSAHVVFSEVQATVEAIAEDVSGQREFERKLQQMERLELVGQLAGGIAHDFNNYLNVILGHESLLSVAIGAAEDLRHHLLSIHKAAEHAAELTQRLMLLGKQERSLSEGKADPNKVVQDVFSMLKGILPGHFVVHLDLSPHSAQVRASAGEIQQIVLNLALNARDAMPDGGNIRITTEYVTFEMPTRTTAGDYLSGRYIGLAVADTGQGMDEITAMRAIDPFFTTKPEGKGTGLGLSSVYATVKRYGGSLDIASTVGKGAQITVYLPAPEGEHVDKRAATPHRMCGRTILVVDDEDGVRSILNEVISAAGFRTIQAATWKDAIGAFEQQSIDVLLCDLHLPDVSSRELLERLRWLAKTSIIVLSGRRLTEDEQRQLYPAGFLQKPFSSTQLLNAIQSQIEIADRPRESIAPPAC